ncbi:hypothetical protein CYMTET_21340, partial [Cymbomonas tetramitiformis]
VDGRGQLRPAPQEAALLKRRAHSPGTVRGCLRYSEEDVVVLDEGDGEETEGIEIATFASAGSFYMVFSPAEPVLFAATTDASTGEVRLLEQGLDEAAVQQQMLQVRLEMDEEDDLI